MNITFPSAFRFRFDIEILTFDIPHPPPPLVSQFRLISFMQAISKLPAPYFIYVAVLQEVAVSNDIVSIENRDGGYTKSDVSSYLSLLWAFKEFERFYLRIQHRSLRADYAVIWHEGEWVQERRTRGYS